MKFLLLTAEALNGLAALKSESIQCVITSPPYWGLRDYQTARWIGGDPTCQHKERNRTQHTGLPFAGAHSPAGSKRSLATRHAEAPVQFRSTCRRCGAVRVDDQLGLERTPEEFIRRLVCIFREVWRVLRPDGVVWLNLGDSWIGDGTGSGDCPGGGDRGERWKGRRGLFGSGPKDIVEGVVGPDKQPNRMRQDGLKPKDLVLMPARVAIALQEDGWWVRQEVIWSKPNPMPESIDDRPTRAHEQIWLLAKSGQPVYWTHRDRVGVRSRPEPDFRWVSAATGQETTEEPRGWKDARIVCPTCAGTGRVREVVDTPLFGQLEAATERECAECDEGRTVLAWRRINLWEGHDYFYDADAIREPHQMRPQARPNGHKKRRPDQILPEHTFGNLRRDEPGVDGNPAGRNSRSVWEIATRPFKGAHFATFPEELARRCMRAGSSEAGACRTCGAPWERVTRREFRPQEDVSPDKAARGHAGQKPMDSSSRWGGYARGSTDVTTVGWRPTCECDAGDPVPCKVLDPFSGAGTVVAVAIEEGRCGIGNDLSLRYNVMARERARGKQPPIAFSVSPSKT